MNFIYYSLNTLNSVLIIVTVEMGPPLSSPSRTPERSLSREDPYNTIPQLYVFKITDHF